MPNVRKGEPLKRLRIMRRRCERFFPTRAMVAGVTPGMARGIRKPAIPKYDGVAKGPTWKDVRRVLQHNTQRTTPSLRAQAVLWLCSIYALRSSEVAGLRLTDIDWREETLCVKRAKRGRYQRYPLQYEVGEAILRYLSKGRPRCACRNVFVTLGQPYRPLGAPGLWQIVSRRFRQVGIKSERRGPHALRHACATHLLKKALRSKTLRTSWVIATRSRLGFMRSTIRGRYEK